jgi:hypothetical protein
MSAVEALGDGPIEPFLRATPYLVYGQAALGA